MKILIVADTYYPDVNGCSYFTQRLAFYKEKAGHEVAVVTSSRFLKHTDEKKNNIRIFGISSIPLSFLYKDFRIARPFFLQKRMEKILNEFQPNIVHLQSHFTLNRAMLLEAQKKGIPVVATNHFMPQNISHYLPLPKKIIHFVEEYMWYDFANIFNKVPFISSPTEIAANLIRSRLNPPVTSVTCGIDLEKFNPKNDGTYIKNLYKIPKDKPVLLSIGRLDKEKQIDQVLKASVQALKKVDFTLVIGGKGAESSNLKKLAYELGISNSVIFTDFVSDEDLPNFFTVGDCFINACPFELQCIAAMEAMATGLSVIAVNAGALPHLVKDGISGALFEKDNIPMLTEKIVDIMSNKEKRKAMGKESLRLISDHGINSMVEGYLSIYKEAIKQKPMPKKYFAILKNKIFVRSLVSSVVVLLVTLVINHFAVIYANQMASSSVTDIFLSNIRVFDVDRFFVYGPVVFSIWTFFVALKYIERLPFLLYSIGLLVVIRAIFISLTHLGPFPTQAVTSPSIFTTFSLISTGNDFFFSGHTALPFMIALIFWDIIPMRILCLLTSVFFGIVVLLGHYHYSIDVLAAFFIAYSIYHMAKVFFKKEQAFFKV